jgi:hypothetical protein
MELLGKTVLYQRQDPDVVKLGMEVNAFVRDYIPALLYFVTPAKVPDASMPYQPDGIYSENELGLPGDFSILHPWDKKSLASNQGEQCNLVYPLSDMPVKPKIIGTFSDCLTAAIVSFTCCTSTSKLYYLGEQVEHKAPYFGGIAHDHKESIFATSYENGLEMVATMATEGEIRQFFMPTHRIGEIIDIIRKYPPQVVTGAAMIQLHIRQKGGQSIESALEKDWVKVLAKEYGYDPLCVPPDKNGNDAVGQALKCFKEYLVSGSGRR